MFSLYLTFFTLALHSLNSLELVDLYYFCLLKLSYVDFFPSYNIPLKPSSLDPSCIKGRFLEATAK
jgi:hypothetical protein